MSLFSLAKNVTVDAKEIKTAFIPPLDDFQRKLDKVVSELHYDDLKSSFFLLMDYIRLNDYSSIIRDPPEILRKRLKNLFTSENLGMETLVEVLGILKKFHIMKNLNVCKHQFKDSHFMCLQKHCKLLYSVCEDLDDNEVEQLERIFQIEPKFATCEEFLCHLLLRNIITKNDMSQLCSAMRSIGRPDIAITLSPSKSTINCYHIRKPSNENPCGLAIIINEEKFCRNDDASSTKLSELEDRNGSHIDRDKLCVLWEIFGFKVEVHENITYIEIKKLFQHLSCRKDVYDIFVLCILSHGDQDVVYSSDCKPLQIWDLVGHVANDCHHFLNKPKLFFIQACQGNEKQKGMQVECKLNSVETYSYCKEDASCGSMMQKHCYFLPKYKDVYVAVSTVPGYVSFRSPELGSLYVTELSNVLKEYGDKEDLELCMKRVNKNMSENDIRKDNEYFKQIPFSSTTLCGTIVFTKKSS